MWPALIAVAVATSTGLLAKKYLFKHSAIAINTSDPQTDVVSTPLALPWERDCEDEVRDGVFRLSSDGDGSSEKKKKKKKKKKKARSRLMKKKKKDVVAAEEEEEQKNKRSGLSLKKRKNVASDDDEWLPRAAKIRNCSCSRNSTCKTKSCLCKANRVPCSAPCNCRQPK